MGKKGTNIGISGGAVSLYLKAEVKHLHDLAKQHPHLTPSEIYATALKSALGEIESKHPLEMMCENQKKEVEEIEKQLKEAIARLKATEQRLPLELARKEWMANLLGDKGLKELRTLRNFLFFDATTQFVGIEKPKNGREGLQRYRELVSKYESTKNGPVVGNEFEVIENLHPESLIVGNQFLCCEIHDDVECGTTIREKDENDRWITRVEANPSGKILCDDLKYRCANHAHIRNEENRGFDLEGNKIPKLKPHWELEELSDEQFAMEKSGMVISQHSGYLAQEQAGLDGYRRNLVISWAMEKWSEENVDDSVLLAKLEYERNTTARATEDDLSKYPGINIGDALPTWAGMPKFSGVGGNRKRDAFIQSMTSEQREEYKSNLESYMRIAEARGNRIRSLVNEWVEAGSVWPYEKMEEEWEDDLSASFSHLRDEPDEKAWDEGTYRTIQAIKYDLKCLQFGSKSQTVSPGLSLSDLRKQLNQ